MPRIFLAFSLFLGVAWAELTTARVLAIINNELITQKDLERQQAVTGQDKGEALFELEEKALLVSAAKRMGISPNEREIKEQMDRLLASQGLSSSEELDATGARLLKERARRDLMIEILQQSVARELAKSTSSRDILRYYEEHKEELSDFSALRMCSYQSPSKALLERIVANPLQVSEIDCHEHVMSKEQAKSLRILDFVDLNGFLPMQNAGNGMHVLHLVEGKIDERPLSFSEAKEQISYTLQAKNAEAAVKNFLAKERLLATKKYFL